LRRFEKQASFCVFVSNEPKGSSIHELHSMFRGGSKGQFLSNFGGRKRSFGADLRIFRENRPIISPHIHLDADLGYQGIDKLHGKTRIPFKTLKGGKLTKNQRRKNKRFRRKRVRIEHTIRHCKVFRIVKKNGIVTSDVDCKQFGQ